MENEDRVVMPASDDLVQHSARISKPGLESLLTELAQEDNGPRSDALSGHADVSAFDRDYNKFDRDYNKFDRDYNKFDRDPG